MKIVFDPDFDEGFWPGPRRGREASAGEDWVGPSRFVHLLETALGIAGPCPSSRERAARLVPAVRALDGFWSESAAVDPFATARRLLEWRDALALGGWRGEGRAPRLVALAKVTAGCAPGLPDRLRAIHDRVARRAPDIESVELFDARAHLEPLWQRTLTLLERRATVVLETEPPPSPIRRGTDLAGARMPGFIPSGDGTLRLLRPAGLLAAGEEVAAWLAHRGDTEDVLLIGSDPALDAALRRHGLPTTGAPHSLHDGAAFQILPLVLDLAWSPQDPQRAYELLSLTAGPVPGAVAWRLREALGQWPAVDSDAWRAALAEGLAVIEDDDRRTDVKRRLDLLFDAPVARGGAYPAAEVMRRGAMLRDWLLKRAATADDADAGGWHAARSQCETLLALVQHSGLQQLTAAQLRHLVIESTQGVAGGTGFTAQAGLTAVDTPAAVVGTARVIVWWSFHASAAPAIRRLPLSAGERAELRGLGVALREPAATAAVQARRWRRPLDQASEALLLVCPEKDGAGEELHPHPLWDELLSRLAQRNGRRAAERLLSSASLAGVVPRRQLPLLPLPAPRPDWSVPAGRIERRAMESPSSVEKLLGCPFQWVLEYAAKLRTADGAQVDDGTSPRLLGELLHAIMNRLFAGPHRDPESAAVAAADIFDREGPRLVAALFLPGADAQRARVRAAAVDTAKTLYALMAAGHLKVVATERECTGEAFGTQFRGRVDLVLGPPARILDLKWSGASRKRQALKDGTAIQLAAYAYLEGTKGHPFPPVAYFVMDAQRLLTTEPQAFPGAEAVDGPLPEETWRALEGTHAGQWQQVAEGRIAAPGAGLTAKQRTARKAGAEDGVLLMPAKCGWCEYTTLCGLAFEEEA